MFSSCLCVFFHSPPLLFQTHQPLVLELTEEGSTLLKHFLNLSIRLLFFLTLFLFFCGATTGAFVSFWVTGKE